MENSKNFGRLKMTAKVERGKIYPNRAPWKNIRFLCTEQKKNTPVINSKKRVSPNSLTTKTLDRANKANVMCMTLNTWFENDLSNQTLTWFDLQDPFVCNHLSQVDAAVQ